MTEQQLELLEPRIQQALDGTLPRAEFLLLQEELKSDSAARSLYYELVALHQSLGFRLSRSATSINSVASELVEARLKRQKKKALTVTAIAAAALVTFTLIALKIISINQDPTSLTAQHFETSPGSVYSIDGSDSSSIPEGELLRVNSRFILSQGTVKLSLNTGVEAIIQAPADLTLKSNEFLYLNEGTGSFKVPEKAIGFTVKTQELTVVDLGTQFGVLSDPNKDDEIHVFKGKVRANALSGLKTELELVKGEAMKVRPNGKLAPTSLAPQRFFFELPRSLPHQHWSFDRTDKLLEKDTTLKTKSLNYKLHQQPTTLAREALEAGRFGQCLHLDGSSRYVETNWDGILGDKPRTVAFWLKLPNRRKAQNPAEGTHSIVAWGEQQDFEARRLSNNSKWTIHLDYTKGKQPTLNASFGGFWFYNSDLELDDDRWHHLVISYSGRSDDSGNPETTFYFDGCLTEMKPAAHQPVRKDADGDIVINTSKDVPMHFGIYLARDGVNQVNPETILTGCLDELFIIEGEIDQSTVLRLMKENRLTE